MAFRQIILSTFKYNTIKIKVEYDKVVLTQINQLVAQTHLAMVILEWDKKNNPTGLRQCMRGGTRLTKEFH